MRPLQLVQRSLRYYWRTNLAVVFGVGVAVAVLAGALLVGESVRASLRELAVGRLGRTDHLIASTHFFRRELVEDLRRQQAFSSCCAAAYGLIAVDGLVARPDAAGNVAGAGVGTGGADDGGGSQGADSNDGGARASGVAVYGIDEEFWTFHGRPSPGALRPREAWLSPALARELGFVDAATAAAADANAGAGTRGTGTADAGAGSAGGGSGEAIGAGAIAVADGSVLVRLQQPSAIPLGTLHGRRDEAGRTIRVSVRGVLSPAAMGEFSLRPRQGDVRAIFLPIARLQADMAQPDRVNALLVSAREGVTEAAADAARTLERLLAPSLQLEDAALKLRPLSGDGTNQDAPAARSVNVSANASAGFVLESDSSLLTEAITEVAEKSAAAQGLRAAPVLTYLAHTIRSGAREIPYSVVSAVDLDSYGPATAGRPVVGDGSRGATTGASPIWLNAWAADALQVRPGAPIEIEYDVWDDAGGLVRHRASFTLAGVLPMQGAGADRTLTPEYPGITGEESLSDWDPPFPLDLSRITPRDEDYWDRYRASPKAIVTLAEGQRLWGSRFGKVTSLRLAPASAAVSTSAPPSASTASPASAAASASGASPAAAMAAYRQSLQAALTPSLAGFVVQPVRATALSASSGTTDFGQYFLYFSFFIVVSGLLLAGLFFRLGVEQRLREVGLLQALGYTPALVRRLFLLEGLGLAIAGSLIGIAGALAYASLIMLGLRTWWVGAVGTTALTLQPSIASLVIGAVAGVITAVIAIALTLRGVTRVPARTLLHGDTGEVAAGSATASGADSRAPGARKAVTTTGDRRAARRRLFFFASLALALGLTIASAARAIDQTAGFFGAGGAALIAALYGLSLRLHRAPTLPTPAPTGRALWRFGQLNAAARPGRTVLSVALIAFATFVIVTVGAFRQEGVSSPSDPRSGTGGYALIAESVAPIADDPGTPAGRTALGLDSPDLQPILTGATIARFRLRPGDDGSCLNLYRPENPRVVAPEEAWVTRGGRFTFASSVAESEAERANPWLLLRRTFPDGAVPTILDLTSLMYVFHKSLGDDIVLARGGGPPITLRIVGALSHSVFQSELIVGEAAFGRLFPGQEGYRLLLVATDEARAGAVGRTLESRLADFGVEAIGTADRLRAYQQVENTYLSTFQALGALGLVLGTLGVGTVLLRNILERRRELALLQAIGYREGHVRSLILAESVSLVMWGLLAGAACALLAVLPAIVDRGGRFPWFVLIGLLAAVLAAGILSSMAATRMAVRLPLLASLRAE